MDDPNIIKEKFAKVEEKLEESRPIISSESELEGEDIDEEMQEEIDALKEDEREEADAMWKAEVKYRADLVIERREALENKLTSKDRQEIRKLAKLVEGENLSFLDGAHGNMIEHMMNVFTGYKKTDLEHAEAVIRELEDELEITEGTDKKDEYSHVFK